MSDSIAYSCRLFDHILYKIGVAKYLGKIERKSTKFASFHLVNKINHIIPLIEGSKYSQTSNPNSSIEPVK